MKENVKKWIKIAIAVGVIYLVVKFLLKILKNEPDTKI
jgi:hypothetical protein